MLAAKSSPIRNSPLRCGLVPLRILGGVAAALLLFSLITSTASGQQRVTLHTRATAALGNEAWDAGELPGSEPVTFTLRLALAPGQLDQLNALLAAQSDPASPHFHRWLTPAQFGERFGVPDDRLRVVEDWLEREGLSGTAVSPSRSRLTITGSAAQVERAFGTGLRTVQVRDTRYRAHTAELSVPAALAPEIAGVSGIDTLPSAMSSLHLGSARLAGARARGATAMPPETDTAAGQDSFAELSAMVDGNQTAVLTLTSSVCAADPSESQAYQDLLRQANAQGITVLATNECAGHGGFPARLPEVTAVVSGAGAAASTPGPGTETRPFWQAARGLPADETRQQPDLAAPSMAALDGALSAIAATSPAEAKGRLGNINPNLYALAAVPDLYTHESGLLASALTSNDTVTSGSAVGPDAVQWDSASGLGTVNLARLIQVFPRAGGPISTTTSLVSSSYALGYGNPFSLTSTVLPASTGTTSPTGTVTFTASTQGVLGTSSVGSDGSATLNTGTLPAGSYTIVATYSGDGAYAGSASTSRVVVTVTGVNATLAATISPVSNVPFGATATVTATVTLPGSTAAPTGIVSAQVQGVTGALSSAILSPNPGGNSATANIVVSVPAPGTYTIQVTCAGTTNFQCQTPVNLSFTSSKGNTITAVTVTPAAPQAGQPITLNATINNAGNGAGAYTFSGNVYFYDNGKLISTAAVGTNQATAALTLSGNRTHNIIATYTGDNYWTSSVSTSVAVSPTILPDYLTLTSSVSNLTSALAGVNITLTATVNTTVTNTAGPTGTVTFLDTYNNAFVTLGTSTVVSNGPTAGVALLNTTGLQAGTHRIYAVYNGDDNFDKATAATMTLSLSDFTVVLTPPTLTLAQGKSAQIGTQIGLVGNFAGSVTLGCTPPANTETTCAFSPASILAGGTTTLNIDTTAPRASLELDPLRSHGWGSSASVVLGGLLLLVRPRRYRSASGALLLLLLSTGMAALLGCGDTTKTTANAPAPTVTDPGTPLGTQVFTITAAGYDGVSTVRHIYQYQVTIQ